MGNEKSLAHTRWNCKYHIVFAPKYRRQVFYREKRRATGSILRKLCEWKSVQILKLNTVQIISITTFTFIADMAEKVAEDDAEVSSITKPGAEIHES